MTIKKRPGSRSADAFIAGAPDAGAPDTSTTPGAPRKKVMKGKREQISVTVPPGLVEAMDRLANRMGVTRAAIINMAISELLEAKGEK